MRVPASVSASVNAAIARLKGEPVRPKSGTPCPSYGSLDLAPVYTEVLDAGFPIGQCWFNVADHVAANRGRRVCGWSVWEQDDGSNVLFQHHAVWERPDGVLVDVTPNSEAAPRTLFLADERAPFDEENLRFPANCRVYANGRVEWEVVNPETGEKKTENGFFLLKAAARP